MNRRQYSRKPKDGNRRDIEDQFYDHTPNSPDNESDTPIHYGRRETSEHEYVALFLQVMKDMGHSKTSIRRLARLGSQPTIKSGPVKLQDLILSLGAIIQHTRLDERALADNRVFAMEHQLAVYEDIFGVLPEEIRLR